MVSAGRLHGHAHKNVKSPTYNTWMDMRRRCGVIRKSARSLRVLDERKWYLDRGITVCERWKYSFLNFLEDMGEKPDGLTLDRIDNNKGYSKDNCRWATRTEQSWNSSRTKLVTFRGKTQSHRAWAREIGISRGTFSRRIRMGIAIEDMAEVCP